MPILIPANSRGHTHLSWLNSRHSFSFGGYQNPDRMGFHGLRVLNDDHVAGGGGFPEHPHRDMEILTWVLAGSLAHKDSTGAARTLPPGTAQLMSAGTGVTHSEFNASDTEPVHFLQVWIEPAQQAVPPRYQELPVESAARANRFASLATPDGVDHSLTIAADARVRVADLTGGVAAPINVATGRVAYLHLASGTASVGGNNMSEGDGLTVEDAGKVNTESAEGGQLLWFDLPQ